VRDPAGRELVQEPELTLKIASGDCDDSATLLLALLLSIGHVPRAVVVDLTGRGYSHIYVVDYVVQDGKLVRVPLDPSDRRIPCGSEVKALRRQEVRV
jgi:hypothetical protein